MKTVKTFLKEHKLIVFILFIWFVIFFVLLRIFVKDWLAVLLSPEVLVGVMVGIAAIYSWLYHKNISDVQLADSKYESDLQLLRNIDKILKDYKDRGEEREIGIELEGFIKDLERKYQFKEINSKSRERLRFLGLYYKFICDKIIIDQDETLCLDGFSDSSYINKPSFSDSEKDTSLKLKQDIANKYNISLKNIRYSKNYEKDAQRDGLKWTTWFNLKEDFIIEMNDNEIQFFITTVGSQALIFQITGKSLKDIVAQSKPRKRQQAGKIVYDFFFGEDMNGNFVEGRHKINLSQYDIKKLEN